MYWKLAISIATGDPTNDGTAALATLCRERENACYSIVIPVARIRLPQVSICFLRNPDASANEPR